MQAKALVGVIGGSGLSDLKDVLKNVRTISLVTPFGDPSSQITIGEVDDISVAFISRHGPHHNYLPSEVPYHANIMAMKMLGVRYLIGVSAVGSLREEYAPKHIALVDQFIDGTTQRVQTFFGKGFVAHVPFGAPVCNELRNLIANVIHAHNDLLVSTDPSVKVHDKATYYCMEGPQYSTLAESLSHQQRAHIIGMTLVSEAKLAREAEIAFAAISLVTDYDCWHVSESPVTSDMVMNTMKTNTANVKLVLPHIVRAIGQINPRSDAHDALSCSFVTPFDQIPPQTKTRLMPILGKYGLVAP